MGSRKEPRRSMDFTDIRIMVKCYGNDDDNQNAINAVGQCITAGRLETMYNSVENEGDGRSYICDRTDVVSRVTLFMYQRLGAYLFRLGFVEDQMIVPDVAPIEEAGGLYYDMARVGTFRAVFRLPPREGYPDSEFEMFEVDS